ncbi:MAG: YlbF family regulator [Planctomycetes bacterium]|nr:YlbF family regulator [Planctomycetota bacterium]
MDEILKLAEQLGEAIAADPRYKASLDIQDKLEKDQEAKKLLEEYNKQQIKIAELERDMKPIEPEDKRRLEDFRTQVTSNELIKELSATRFEFANLMRQVDEAIQSKLRIED